MIGAVELEPTIRPEAKDVIEQLRQRNLDFYIISGDQEGPTQALAQKLGIDNYFANTLPENKAKLVEQLQQEGGSLCGRRHQRFHRAQESQCRFRCAAPPQWPWIRPRSC
ncbi:MAG: HAD family hydrolase [Caldilineaceae bacterium]